MNLLMQSIFAQASARIFSQIRTGQNFFDAAVSVTEICPPEVIEGRPVKALQGQFERISASPFGVSHLTEIAAARGGVRPVGATRMYVFKDVTVAKRWVISRCRHEEFVWPKSEWAFSEPEFIAEAALSDSIQGSRYFGHWLRDDCATNLLIPDHLPFVGLERPRWKDEDFYSGLLNLRRARSIRHARIQELTYFEDLSNNSHKLKRLKAHRASIRRKMQSGQKGGIVYLSRGPSARARMIQNEAELIGALASRGVKIVVAGGSDPSSFFQEILDADLIISVEGSQCAHAIYALRDNAAGLITLQPFDRFYLPHLEWVRLFGYDFGVVVSEREKGEFYIDPQEVLRTIDLF